MYFYSDKLLLFTLSSVQLLLSLVIIGYVIAVPQLPEINDQFDMENDIMPNSKSTSAPLPVTNKTEIQTTTEKTVDINEINVITNEIIKDQAKTVSNAQVLKITDTSPSFVTRLYTIVAAPFVKLLSQIKVRTVLRNIGICVVNGAMELISYYLPAPLIPFVASAAGMIIPFEPVEQLRDKMPVTSYQRAFQRAIYSFLGTFDKFKMEDPESDPYMALKFNRRFMKDERKKEKKYDDYGLL